MYWVNKKRLSKVKICYICRKECGRFNNKLTDWFAIKIGVSKSMSSHLGTWPFNMFIDGVFKGVKVKILERTLSLVNVWIMHIVVTYIY